MPPLSGIKDKRKFEEERRQIQHEFTPDEIAAKINSLSTSGGVWDRDNLEEHNKRHGKELKTKTIEEYKKLSREIAKSFDFCYLYKEKEDTRVLYYNKEQKTGTTISLTNGKIITCFPVRNDYKRDVLDKRMVIK